MSIENISRLVEEKCGNEVKLSSNTVSDIRSLEESLNRFREEYESLRGRRGEIEKAGISFSDINNTIKSVLSGIIR